MKHYLPFVSAKLVSECHPGYDGISRLYPGYVVNQTSPSGRLCLRLRHPLNDLLWCNGQLINLNTEGLQGILYGSRHCWRGHHTSAFAAAFDAVGSEGRGCLVMVDLDSRYLGGGWQEIVVQGSRQVLASGTI